MSDQPQAPVQPAASQPALPQKIRRPRPQWLQTLARVFREPKALIGFIILALFILIAIFAPLLATHDPMQEGALPPLQPPSKQFLFGTTGYGDDVFTQWVYATRTSLSIGFQVAVIATALSVILGVYSGFKGGKVDAVVNWVTQVMLVLPGYPLIIMISSYIPNAGSEAIVWVLGLTSWPGAARMKRAQAMTYRTRDFVLAAKLGGFSDFRNMLAEVFPNMMSLVFNTFISMISWGIFGEAFLRFLGIGSTHTPSWGNMLNQAQNGNALMQGAWWWFIPPGLSITLVILSLTLINYGIDEVSNPRLQKPLKLPKALRRKLQAAAGEEGM
ncbi:MAG: ABC transporter permease [Alicyclobacillus sp.]|nr:ABC transporter permease [Alicyclobacillus sp.]